MKQKTYNFLFITALLALIAVTVGSALLLKAAVCMAAMAVLALISVIGAYATLKVSTQEADFVLERGSIKPFSVRIRYAFPLPVGNIALKTDKGETFYADVLPFRNADIVRRIKYPHVGIYKNSGGTVYITDVFGLFVLKKRLSEFRGNITVLPVSFETDKPNTTLVDSGAGKVRMQDDASQPSGVRQWVEGDLLRRIHWKLTMKIYNPHDTEMKPFVKTYDEQTRPETLIIPDLSQIDAIDERARSLRDGICDCAYSVAKLLLDEHEPVRLVLRHLEGSEVYGAQESDAGVFASALAAADFSEESDFADLVTEAMRRIELTSAVVFVTTRLNARIADMLIRLKNYSALSVTAIYVADTLRSEVSALTSKLEASDIPVRIHTIYQKPEEK